MRTKGPAKPKKTFADLFASYKTYDPQVEGYGDPSEWMDSFIQRMGFEEAEAIMAGQNDSPRGILGVSLKATWEEIKKAYRALAMKVHPDHAVANGMTKEQAETAFKKVCAAYEILAREFGK